MKDPKTILIVATLGLTALAGGLAVYLTSNKPPETVRELPTTARPGSTPDAAPGDEAKASPVPRAQKARRRMTLGDLPISPKPPEPHKWETIEETIADNYGPIDACKKARVAEGLVTIRFTVDTSGDVSNAQILPESLEGESVARCILEAIKDMPFLTAEAARTVRFVFNLAHDPDGFDADMAEQVSLSRKLLKKARMQSIMNFDEAITNGREALEHGVGEYAHRVLAISYEKRGDADLAIEHYNTVLGGDCDAGTAGLIVRKIESLGGTPVCYPDDEEVERREEANEQKRIEQSDNPSRDKSRELHIKALGAKDPHEIIRLANEALDAYESPDIHGTLGDAYERLGDKDAAIKHYNNWLANSPCDTTRDAERHAKVIDLGGTPACTLHPSVASPIAAGFGAIEIRHLDEGIVSVDGELIGHTPLHRFEVPVGKRRVTIVFDKDKSARTYDAEITEGQTQVVFMGLHMRH